MRRRAGGLWLVVLLGCAVCPAAPALAAGPFLTDNAETLAAGHWQVDLFSIGTAMRGATTGLGPELEADYGATSNVQLHVIAPFGYRAGPGKTLGFGYGDTEFGIKARLPDAADADWLPQVALYPLVELPTGNQPLGLSTGHDRVFLPLWLSKDIGPWTVFGGGGYWINPGAGRQDWWFAGAGLDRRITAQLSLGAELFNETANLAGGKDATGFDLGATYDLSETWHVLAAIGSGLRNADTTNRFSYYLGVRLTF
jgi:hypothetical protein